MADTQMAKAKKGELTPEMEAVALQEGLEPEALMEKVASGRAVIPANVNHRGLTPRGIGEGLRVKVNANIGTSSDQTDLEEELRKLEAALEAGTDTVMDLSTGGDLDQIRRKILERCPLPLGTVPIYQAAI
ncbi:MAG: phosphomethylpyrimidine synthase, partial [Deltaproteobacteria bacterium]